MTPNPDFKGMPLFNVEYINNGKIYSHCYNRNLHTSSHDLAQLDKIFNDKEHHTASMRQPSFL